MRSNRDATRSTQSLPRRDATRRWSDTPAAYASHTMLQVDDVQVRAVTPVHPPALRLAELTTDAPQVATGERWSLHLQPQPT